jgi:hypothetical protein
MRSDPSDAAQRLLNFSSRATKPENPNEAESTLVHLRSRDFGLRPDTWQLAPYAGSSLMQGFLADAVGHRLHIDGRHVHVTHPMSLLNRYRVLHAIRLLGLQNVSKLPSQARRMATSNSGVGVGGASDANAYCRELVRKHDYEAYLCSYFYPRAAQPGYFALRAFNVGFYSSLCLFRSTN